MGKWCGWAVLSVLAACGGKAADERGGPMNEAGSSNVGAAGSGNVGAAGAASAGTSGSAQSAGSNGVSGAPQCASFVDDLSLVIPVTIVNRTKQPVHIAPREMYCDTIPLFEVRDDTDTVLPPLSYCRTACEAQMSDEPFGGCPAICLGTDALTLAPGEGHTVLWSGLYQAQTALPHGCFPNHPDHDAPSLACDRALRVQSGSYTLTAYAGTSLDCDSFPDGCPPCKAIDTGGCTRPNALAAGSPLIAKTTARIGVDNNGVQLAFTE